MKSPQSCQMDLGSPFTLFSVSVMTICLLGAARCSNDKSCPCPEIPIKDLTLRPTENCFKINQTFRYKCEGDNKRKAGTSNLIKCKQNGNGPPYWDLLNLSLKCIPVFTSRTTTQPPQSTATNKISCPCPEVPRRHLTLPPTENCFKINQTFRYDCEGDNKRKAGTSNLIKCTQTDNDSPHWVPSNLSLECIPVPSRTTTQPPQSTATKAHTDIPHDSTIATTVTASSSPQMTQSLSPSASVTAEPDRPEPTSPGLQAPSGRTQGKEQGARKTEAPRPSTAISTSTEPSNNGARHAHALPPAARTAIGCASVVIVCALIGIIFYCYRRRSKRYIPPQRQEEQIPMKQSEL